MEKKKVWLIEYVDAEDDFVICNSELNAYRHVLTKYADLILDSQNDDDFSKKLIASDLLELVKTKSLDDFAYIREVEVYEG